MMRLGVGISDFKKIIESNNFYADKSLLIKDLIDFNDEVTLITRPRRFGKTLNLEMLRYFFSLKHKGNAALFHQLKIWQEGAEYQEHQGRYPTIFITFKSNKKDTFAEAALSLKASLAKTYGEFTHLLGTGLLREEEEETFQRILKQTANDEELQRSLGELCEFLHRFYQTKVLLLIDEYDTPMQASFLNGYWQEMANLMRGLFGAALKDNSYLYKGVVTGITRIAKENLFSGINNLRVFSVLDHQYSQYFGLTEPDVKAALVGLNLEDQFETVRDWYNGYVFGHGTELYNPWSVVNFLAAKVAEPYWANTSDNALIKKYARDMPAEGKQQLESLIRGEEIEARVDKYMVYSDLDQSGSVDRMWTLFLISGYLKHTGEGEEGRLKLKVPNKEVMSIYEETVLEWFARSEVSPLFQEFIRALEAGDILLMESHLSLITEETFSHFDTKIGQAESFYHAFFLGMLMALRGRYWIDSNKQSGYGRYDIMMEPQDKTRLGYIIEFKSFNARLNHRDLDEVAASALQQIEDRKYETELKRRGITRIKKLAIVFKGQQVKIVEAGQVAKKRLQS
jgi:hypothetical protein